MRGHNYWSYAPYNPILRENPGIYICRIVPYESSIHFEWLDIGEKEYEIYCRKRFTVDFLLVGTTTKCEFDITGLTIDTDYEFYVKAGNKQSFKRLARCGKLIDGIASGGYAHEVVEHWASFDVEMLSAGADFEFIRDGAINNSAFLDKVHKKL